MTDSMLPNPTGRVLAAVDASIYGQSVADLAAWAAQRLATGLDFLHVLEREVEQMPISDLSGSLVLGAQEALLLQLTEIDEKRAALARERGRQLLEAAAARASAAGIAEPGQRLRHGGLLDTLLELEPETRLLVIGKRGEHVDFARGHLGGQLERVVRAMQHPLLVAARAFRPIERVMLAFDGSPTVLKGVAMLAESPLLKGLELRLQVAGRADEATARSLTASATRLRAAGLQISTAIDPGEPEKVLAEAVARERIDLLVMGAYGHSRIRQLIVGSTTTALLRACPVPVLLLR
jgi:nucleotide-binding universal stress UspA family protein